MFIGIDHGTTAMRFSGESGEFKMSREEALRVYSEPPYMEEELLEYFKKRLGLTDSDFDSIMALPPKYYTDYPTYKRAFERLKPMFWAMAKAQLVPRSFYIKFCSKSEI